MNITVNQFAGSHVLDFAVSELCDYLKRMDAGCEFTFVNNLPCDKGNYLNIGCHTCFDELLPAVENKEEDDAVYIDVTNGNGIITGTNERSVLIAVYRLLKELGCAFIRPGKDSEIIPQISLTEKSVFVNEAASYRHREVCIEGACSYEHVADLVDWLPKVGMNGYFTQFIKPTGFFRVWYEHDGNPYPEKEYKTAEEYADILKRLEDEICKRGIMYSAVGHSWNCESIGLDGSYWYKLEEPVSEEIVPLLAEVNGKRELFHNMPILTNLCYSNPKAQDLMTDRMIAFLKEKTYVKYLYFWLADGTENECTCEACSKKSPADWYFQMINLLDEKLTAEHMDTKVVPVLRERYMPTTESIKNPDRVSMLYAPIFRNFSEPYPSVINDAYLENAIRVIPDDPNVKLEELLNSTNNCMGILRTWQDIFQGDFLLYDYQMIWFHFMDPSYMFCSDIIYEDIKNLKVMGMNGMSSCQGQRVFLPTVLPMATLAQTLWNRDMDYEAFKKKTLTDEYGPDGVKVGELLSRIAIPELTQKMSGLDALDWEKTKGDATIALIKPKYAVIDELRALIEKNLAINTHPDAVKQSWNYLRFYPQIAKYYMDVWTSAFGEANIAKTRRIACEMVDYVMKNEQYIHKVFDGCLFRRRIFCFFNNQQLPGVVLGV